MWKIGVVVVEIDDGPVRKDALHAGLEHVPLLVAPEVVAHEEAAAQQIFAQFRGLRVGQIPVAHLDGVKPGPVVDVVAVVQIHRLLHGADVDAGEAADGAREMPVGARIILVQMELPLAPVAAIAARNRSRRRHADTSGARTSIRFFVGVGGQREIIVFDAGIFAERPLEGVERP